MTRLQAPRRGNRSRSLSKNLMQASCYGQRTIHNGLACVNTLCPWHCTLRDGLTQTLAGYGLRGVRLGANGTSARIPPPNGPSRGSGHRGHSAALHWSLQLSRGPAGGTEVASERTAPGSAMLGAPQDGFRTGERTAPQVERPERAAIHSGRHRTVGVDRRRASSAGEDLPQKRLTLVGSAL